jgi:hypothetical protein
MCNLYPVSRQPPAWDLIWDIPFRGPLAVCATHLKVVSGVRGRSKRACAMTPKEIAVEFVIPTVFAIAVAVMVGLVFSAATLSG